MNALKPITVVGGGLAGLTLGIGLRQKGIPATVWETGGYPRHRVCGEFISGDGLAVLERLSLLSPILQAGARQASTVAFFTGSKASPEQKLPRPAVCLSRFKLDALLAEQFREHGGELRAHQRWSKSEFGEGIVRASGRRLQPVDQGWRWFGLKAHARNVSLITDLEMHFAGDSYVGLCRLSDDEVNVCGLFRRRAGESEAVQNWERRLRGRAGSLLFRKLEGAVFLPESFCAVAGLSLCPNSAGQLDEVRLGDALTMIPPVTGNGMSLAFESAELAVEPLVAFSRGESQWSETQQVIAQRCDETFARRLAWASGLQRALFNRIARSLLLSAASHCSPLWWLFFLRTR